ncbi:hypothetical protein [uncultured Microbacterium sp.]|uniref:hypothetical protein n=1 Tax=uncultured Microbacterium sp. TaxID=191216 RepID=UPI0028DB5BAA|nr:hypothetical protein [uncultured Microbacterium sp.]
MSRELHTHDFVDAVQQVWAEKETPLVPEGFVLTGTEIVDGFLIVEVTRTDGAKYGYRAALPQPLEGGVDRPLPTPEDWTLWNILVPLMEELETDPDSRITASNDGVRWLPEHIQADS